MARVKISEYAAKRLLQGETYAGIQIRTGTKEKLPKVGIWVVKVDQGIKKRFKQGLVKVGVSSAQALQACAIWEKKDFSQFLVEPLMKYDSSEEQYFSLERVREGMRLLFTKDGGVDIEAHPEKVQMFILNTLESISRAEEQTGLPRGFLSSIVETCSRHHVSFLEINPLVVVNGTPQFLDAACLVDSAGAYFVRNSWEESDVIVGRAKHVVESRVEALAQTTPASLKLSVLNPNGSLFLLLSGGGGSIVIADEAQALGVGTELGNYGEYSGGPTREETYLYTKEVLSLMLASKSKKKALVIAGGVANFTDVQKTFAGVIDALAEVAERMRSQGIRVFVRRGGPNEAQGLAGMKKFLEQQSLLGAVYGSDATITSAMKDAVEYIKH